MPKPLPKKIKGATAPGTRLRDTYVEYRHLGTKAGMGWSTRPKQPVKYRDRVAFFIKEIKANRRARKAREKAALCKQREGIVEEKKQRKEGFWEKYRRLYRDGKEQHKNRTTPDPYAGKGRRPDAGSWH